MKKESHVRNNKTESEWRVTLCCDSYESPWAYSRF